MFSKILIANRGEIACRVIKTARRMGIKTVAVYSDADRNAMHVAMADEAYHIGPASARESYLVGDKIVEVARKSGAQAVHPGYGFLSENAGFAEACAKAGIIFIGPPPSAIRAMGSKSEAKKIMEKARVRLVPGYHGDDQSEPILKAAAERIGYPVLIKASAGGGGKGMRVVESEAKFIESLAGAKREAKGAFSDDHVLIEKYLTRPRHIEIQVFADTTGNCVYLFERDCSIQRRHQKVVEEAPAPGMPLDRRRAMGEAAVAAAKAIGYVGAGTVEFIANQDGTFYFMEMNTRLQVEHPVTEMITGQDLVEWQLKVASGERLPLLQDDLAINGHAIEVRLYAEDPVRNFLPSIGPLRHLRLPAENAHVRVDTGVRQGDEVSMNYDPMIAKIVVWDRDRLSAIRRLAAAMADTQVVGVSTNTALLAAIAAHPAFAAGDLDTGFIERHKAEVIVKPGAPTDQVLALACVAQLSHFGAKSCELQKQSLDPWSPWGIASGWRVNGASSDTLGFKSGDNDIKVGVTYRRDSSYELALPGGVVIASGELDEDGLLSATIAGVRQSANVVRLIANDGSEDLVIMAPGINQRLKAVDPRNVSAVEEAPHGTLQAPMPGKVIDVKVKDGEKVRRGQPVVVLEAMKMEHTISAPSDGTIKKVKFSAGELVDEGVELVEFEPAG
jgi:3-methylcrotonyl-CoA carboxylase alpha subunit